MTYPNDHLYLTIHWTNGGAPAETGQTGIRFDTTTAASQSLVDACASAVSTFWSATNPAIDWDYRLTFLRLAQLGTNGKYVPGTVAYDHNYSPVVNGGGSGGSALYRYPLQTATVSTLNTAIARGQAHKGRLYLPPICVALDSGYHVSNTYTNSRSQYLATMISALNTALSAPATVFSKGTKAAPTVGAKHAVTSVKTDNKLDTQRRRARQETATYSTDWNIT